MAAKKAFAGIAALFLMATAGAVAATAQDGGGQINGMKLSGNEPIQIESDRLEVLDKEHKAIFSGNVLVVQGTSLIKAGRMTVYYVAGQTSTAGAGAIDHLEVDDTVYLKSNDQVVTGDRGTFDMKTEIFTMTGKEVVLTQGESVLVGCKLVANMGAGTAKLEGCGTSSSGSGRVKVLLKPGEQKTQ
jgi:lipopolysaccharide export system protein LptA